MGRTPLGGSDSVERGPIRLAAVEGGQDVFASVVAAALTEAGRRERIVASFADVYASELPDVS